MINMLKQINWKVRLNNPTWWKEIITALLLPTLVSLGTNFSDITSWQALGEILMATISNPYLVVATIISVWNACIDPTTKGIADSKQAMTYNTPKE